MSELAPILEELAESNGEIVVHTRNSRRHLLEIKPQITQMTTSIMELVEILKGNSLLDEEMRREMLRKLDALKPDAGPVDRGIKDAGADGGGGVGLLGGLGIMAGLGAIAGLLAGLVKGYVTGVAKLLDDVALRPIRAFFRVICNGFGKVRDTAKLLGERLIKFLRLDDLFDAAKTRVTGRIAKITDGIVDGLRLIRTTFVEGTLIQRVIDALKGPLNFITDSFNKGMDLIRPLFAAETSVFGKISGYFKEFFLLTDEAGGKAKSIIATITDAITKPFKGIRNTFNTFTPFFDAFKPIGAILGRLLIPINILIGIFDAGFESFDAWGKVNGNIFQKILGSLVGALGGLIDGLVFQILDLGKSALSWIAGALGFEAFEAKLDSFSFSEWWNNILDELYKFISAPVDTFKEWVSKGKKLLKDVIGSLMPSIDAFFKPILRSILPTGGSKSDGWFGWVKKAVSSVIPDAVYDYAGLNKKTGELIPQEVPTSGQELNAEEMNNAEMKRMQQIVQINDNKKTDPMAQRNGTNTTVVGTKATAGRNNSDKTYSVG